MNRSIVYGPGGFDPTKPNNNIIEETELPDLEPTPEELARNSAVAKLKKLGLTEEEALALVGG
jgi:hypothetical protein